METASFFIYPSTLLLWKNKKDKIYLYAFADKNYQT
jgi:hypothetical protein